VRQRLEQPVHTPLVPFGVEELNAVAGVMITASHNPAKDNGYKVYWSNGCQIIPPHDIGIAESILQNLEPMTWDTEVLENSLLCEGALGHVRDAYFRQVHEAAVPSPKGTDIRFAYTAMHGVGLPYMTRAVRDLGLESNMVIVEQQAHPDPNFPSVQFPNPEEKGALDIAMDTADRHSVALILASDPDADRLAVAEKVGGRWHQFTGNQLGILLASHLFDTYPPEHPRDKLAMLASTVSSQMLLVMAQKEGFHFTETLTGFKWLGNVALDLEADGYKVRFAFEEAIGYMIPSVTHDKDAVSAAAVFLSAAAIWKKQGLTPYAKLQQLYQRYGCFEDANTYLISPSPETTEAVFASIRALGSPYPKRLGKRKIVRWRDLTGEGYDSETHDHRPKLPVSKDQMITCELEGGVRFTARASGTEPKIKLYIEGRAGMSGEAKGKAEEVLADLLTEWFEPEEYGLRLA